MRVYIFTCVVSTNVDFLRCLFRLDVFFVKICLRPCLFRLSFPVPVTLKRERDALCVFIFGTSLSPYYTPVFSEESSCFFFSLARAVLESGAKTVDIVRPTNFGCISIAAISATISQIRLITFAPSSV